MELAGQCRRKIEAESVNMHLGNPVPQRIHNQLQRVRMPNIQAISRTRVVHIVLTVIIDQAIISRVVDTPEAQRRPHMVAFSRVVIDDVENDFDVIVVEGPHHILELRNSGAGFLGSCIVLVRCQEAEGVVSPVVAETELVEPIILIELVDRHELDSCHAKVFEVLDDRGVGEASIGAAIILGHVRVRHGHALDVSFVNNGLIHRVPR